MMAFAAKFAGDMGGFGIYIEQDGLTVFIVFLRIFVWILGSIATLVFIFKGDRDGT
jgi:hypothetical protein